MHTSEGNGPIQVFVLFRKSELYSMAWSGTVDLSNYIIAAAPFGGPIGEWCSHIIELPTLTPVGQKSQSHANSRLQSTFSCP